MKKTPKIIFGVLVLLAIGTVVSCGMGIIENPVAESVADQLIPAIVSDWSADKFKEHFVPDGTLGFVVPSGKQLILSRAGQNPKRIDQVFDILRKEFGAMESYSKYYSGVTCRDTYDDRFGTSLLANCKTRIKFEHGNALIFMTLRNQSILSFVVDYNQDARELQTH